MTKLTSEQRLMVEKHHKLIYWFASMRNIDLEEWYGMLAIELCNTVATFDADKGSLSNYYNLRANRMMINEYSKQGRMKRTHNGMTELTDFNQPTDTVDTSGEFEIKEFIDLDDSGVLELKMHGYTQAEIADKLSMSQASVSRTLNRLRDEFNGGTDD